MLTANSARLHTRLAAAPVPQVLCCLPGAAYGGDGESGANNIYEFEVLIKYYSFLLPCWKKTHLQKLHRFCSVQ
jgi:hypothetical protein